MLQMRLELLTLLFLLSLTGCRSARFEFDTFDFIYDCIAESTLHRNESEYERQERASREFFDEND